MSKGRAKREESWEEFEAEVLRELRKARQRGLLSDSLDEMEEMVDEVGKAMQAKLLATLAEQREPSGGQECPACGEPMQRRGKAARQLKTSKGEVRFKRARWVCPACGTSLFPPG